jgi:hypothetical protein
VGRTIRLHDGAGSPGLDHGLGHGGAAQAQAGRDGGLDRAQTPAKPCGHGPEDQAEGGEQGSRGDGAGGGIGSLRGLLLRLVRCLMR